MDRRGAIEAEVEHVDLDGELYYGIKRFAERFSDLLGVEQAELEAATWDALAVVVERRGWAPPLSR